MKCLSRISVLCLMLLIVSTMLSAQQSQYFTGDGGRGKTLSILELQTRNLPNDHDYLPALVQGHLGTIIAKYSAIEVIDRVVVDRLINDNMNQAVYRDGNLDVAWVGSLTHARYVMIGELTGISTGFSITISVNENTPNAPTVARHTGNYSLSQLEDQNAAQSIAKDILTQMGVSLTPNAISELDAINNRNAAQIALAQGISAQRQGTEVQALSYFFQAAQLDPSLLEAVTRSNDTFSNITSGNIGADARNEVAWGRSWLKRLEETEEFLRKAMADSPPFTLQYSEELKQSNVNIRTGTADLSIDVYIATNEAQLNSIVKVVQAVYDGLRATNKARDWDLANWPTSSITQPNPFTRANNYPFNVSFEIENARNKVIGSADVSLPQTVNTSFANGKFNASVNTSQTKTGTITFRSVNVDDITDEQMTIRISRVNGASPDIAKFTIEALNKTQWAQIERIVAEEQARERERIRLEQERERERQQRLARYQPGYVFSFAGRDWRVLERRGNQALIISERIIENRRFDARSNNWANSEIRRYLNGEFYNSFSASDRAKIGTHSTGDKIFLLSREEAERYFRSNAERVARNTSGTASWWWLGSPIPHNRHGASGVNSDGNVYSSNIIVTSVGGVRPALWLNL